MKVTSIRVGSRVILFLAALPFAALAFSQQARSADFLPASSGVLPPAPGETRLFIEGGAFWTGGDPIKYGQTGIFANILSGLSGLLGGNNQNPALGSTVMPKVGWDVAGGFDHRFAGTNWHVNGQFRYGQAGDGSDAFTTSNSITIATGGGGLNVSLTDATDANLDEYHWQADIGAGYDVISGPIPLQFNFGLRVAELYAKNVINSNDAASISITFVVPPPIISATASGMSTETRSFLGAGPRVGIEGSIPLAGGFTLDYLGDAALLVGNTKISTETTSSFALNVNVPAPPVLFNLSSTGNRAGTYWSNTIPVGNVDLQAGFGYWFTPNMKLAVSYRLDAFFGALKQAPDDSATNAPEQSIDRYYHGPKLTLVGRL